MKPGQKKKVAIAEEVVTNGYVIPMRQLADRRDHHVGVSSTAAKFFKRNSRYAQAGASSFAISRVPRNWSLAFELLEFSPH